MCFYISKRNCGGGTGMEHMKKSKDIFSFHCKD